MATCVQCSTNRWLELDLAGDALMIQAMGKGKRGGAVGGGGCGVS
jgi:hypothetical protein